MIKFIKFATIPVALLSTFQVSANTLPIGFYIGAGAGNASYDVPFRPSTPEVKVDIDDSDTYFNVFVGYQFNDYFSLEGGYYDLGETSITSTLLTSEEFPSGVIEATTEITGFNTALVGRYPFNPSWSAFGKVGVFFWDADTEGSNPSRISQITPDGSETIIFEGQSYYSISHSSEDIYYGAGLSYHIESITVSAEYLVFEGDGDDIDTIGLTASYHF